MLRKLRISLRNIPKQMQDKSKVTQDMYEEQVEKPK